MLFALAKKKFAISFLVGFVLYVFDFDFLALILFGYSAILWILYREKKRYNLFNDSAIHVPIDGKVIGIDKLKDNICIIIENGFLNFGSVLAPINSNNVEVNKINGLNYSLFSRHSTILNEKIYFSFKKDEYTIKMTTICGFMPNSLYKNKFDKVSNGDTLSHLVSGVVHIYIPNTSQLKIDIGDNVKARSILGYF